MSELLTCYFSVMRYVPDVVRDESINVGVVLFEPKAHTLLVCPLTGLSHVQRFDPNADRGWLKEYLTTFQRVCGQVSGKPPAAPGNMDDWTTAVNPLHTLHQQSANVVQFTAPRTVLTEDPQTEVKLLYGRYVAPRKAPRKEYLYDPQLRRRIKDTFVEHHLLAEGRVQTDYETEVRGDHISFPLYYQNGRLNLIEPISFAVENQHEKQDEVRRLIYKKLVLRESPQPQHENVHLLVVAHPPLDGSAREREVFSRCMRMLQANETDTHEVERDKQETWRQLVQRVKRDLGINE
jgi:hypothetical protein